MKTFILSSIVSFGVFSSLVYMNNKANQERFVEQANELIRINDRNLFVSDSIERFYLNDFFANKKFKSKNEFLNKSLSPISDVQCVPYGDNDLFTVDSIYSCLIISNKSKFAIDHDLRHTDIAFNFNKIKKGNVIISHRSFQNPTLFDDAGPCLPAHWTCGLRVSLSGWDRSYRSVIPYSVNYKSIEDRINNPKFKEKVYRAVQLKSLPTKRYSSLEDIPEFKGRRLCEG